MASGFEMDSKQARDVLAAIEIMTAIVHNHDGTNPDTALANYLLQQAVDLTGLADSAPVVGLFSGFVNLATLLLAGIQEQAGIPMQDALDNVASEARQILASDG
jgi:hypothetical protein